MIILNHVRDIKGVAEMPKEEAINEFKDVQEMIALVNKLNPEQKKIVLTTLRGAVLIADADKKGA